MKTRWITAIIGIPITLSIWFISHLWQELPFLLLLTISGLIINFEIMTMTKDKEGFSYPFFVLGVLFTLSSIFSYFFGMHMIDFSVFMTAHFIFFIIFFYIIMVKLLLNAHNISQNFEHLGFYLLIYITLVILSPQMFLIKVLHINSWVLILLFASCWISDAFGLFVGSAFGKTPLTMLPSKTKTLEGYTGSFIFTILLGVIFYYIQGVLHLPFQWGFSKWVLFGACMSVSSNIGDLIESIIKRWCDKKDSGVLLPGMGGMFDAIDGQIYSVPIILLFFYL